jgi:hypothetical protein
MTGISLSGCPRLEVVLPSSWVAAWPPLLSWRPGLRPVAPGLLGYADINRRCRSGEDRWAVSGGCSQSGSADCGGWETPRTVVSDEAWAWLAPLLPPSVARRGGRWRDRRQLIKGIVFRYRTGRT